MCELFQCPNLETRLLRALTVALAAIFMVFAVTLITMGILCKTLWVDYFQILKNSMSPIPVLLILFGFILIAITSVGFVGIVRKNWIILVVYGILLGLVIFVEVGAAITCAVYQTQLHSTVQTGFKDVIKNDLSAMDSIQNKYFCCGVNGYQDYNNNSIPSSCCPVSSPCTSNNSYPTGCFSVFVSSSSGNFGTAIGIIVAMIFIHLLSIIGIARLYNLLKAAESVPPT